MFFGFFLGVAMSGLIAYFWQRSSRISDSAIRKVLRYVLVDGILDNVSSFRFFELRQMKILLGIMLMTQFAIPSFTGATFLNETLYSQLLFQSSWTPYQHRVFYGLFSLILAIGLSVSPRKSLMSVVVCAWTSIFYLYTALLLGFDPYNVTNLSAGTFLVLSFYAAITTFWTIFLTYYGSVQVGKRGGRKA